MEESALLTDWMTVRQQINELLDQHLGQPSSADALARFLQLTQAEEEAYNRYVSAKGV